MCRRNKHHKAIQDKLARAGMCVEVRMIAADLTEAEAFQVEIDRIAHWANQGVKLANKSDGGEGNSGHVMSSKTRELQRSVAIANGNKPPVLCGEANGFYGRKHTEETRQKISESSSRRRASKETREKLKSRFMSEEYRRAHGEKSRARMIAYWANKKAAQQCQ